MRAFKILDILVVIIIVLVALFAIYILWPLLVAIIIMAIGYFIYRWYTKRKRQHSNNDKGKIWVNGRMNLDQKRFYLPMLIKVFLKILQTSSYCDMDSHYFELFRTLQKSLKANSMETNIGMPQSLIRRSLLSPYIIFKFQYIILCCREY